MWDGMVGYVPPILGWRDVYPRSWAAAGTRERWLPAASVLQLSLAPAMGGQSCPGHGFVGAAAPARGGRSWGGS